MSPTSHGWHTLEIKASDEYNNTRTEIYKIGFDNSVQNIHLVNPTNGSLIGDNTGLQFSAYNIDYALHEWDRNGTSFNMTDLGYFITVPKQAGYHNLTVTSYDEFEVVNFFYVFTIDNSTALITLQNIANESTQPAGKVIDIEVTDDSTLDVQYKWDAQSKLPWSPFSGNIYRTYLPGLNGPHTLIVYTNDSFGHYIEKTYSFTTDNTVLGVELQNLINNSYYYGGNEVNLTITGSNDTIYYQWDGGGETKIALTESFLLLSGVDALPSSLGVHNLTLRTFDISNNQIIITFLFEIDQEDPTIDNSINNYDGKRFLTSDIFDFILSDNFTSSDDLEVYYSINGGDNISLTSPYDLSLSFFSDGDYTLTLYVFDIANNLATTSITFTIDTTKPQFTIINIEDLVQVLGIYYVPTNTLVSVFITENDPVVISTYSWGGTIYTGFTNSFNLNFPDGTSTLYINASDSLGNEELFTITLTVDSIAPIAFIQEPLNGSKINYNTTLEFNVNDIIVETIKQVEYSWDLFYPASAPVIYDGLGNFELKLHTSYDEGVAILYIITEDMVENTQTYLFVFSVDLTIPIPALYIYNTTSLSYENVENFEYVRGNTSIWYDESENIDLSSLSYYWDDDEANIIELSLLTPYIYAPTGDGPHNLTVILKDNVEGTHPNTNETVYFFIIDDITIEVITPLNLLNETHQLIYNDVFSFTIKIYDSIDNIPIDGLIWNQLSLNISNNLDLDIVNNTVDSQTFEFIIHATNVSDTSLVFEFSKSGSNIHQVVVNLSIARKEGYLTNLDSSTSLVTYEEIITINVTLNDEFANMLNISAIFVNGTQIFNFFEIPGIPYLYQFDYSSKNTNAAGHYVLDIRVESSFYYGETNSSYLFEVDILPIPLVLDILVSNYNITEGNNVVINGLLTFVNGTPLEGYNIIFYIYVHYKNETVGVYALTLQLETYTAVTNATGFATTTYLLTEEMDYITIRATFEGNQILGSISYDLEGSIFSIKPPGLPRNILYAIIGGALVFVVLASFIVYKLTRSKPLGELMEEITEEEIYQKLAEINPGIILSIFDQQKGAIPVVENHSLETHYQRRMSIGIDNFLLRICDQAYSSLGFEEHHTRRRIGSIILPKERMVGLIHGIQLPNPVARGGFENLSLIILVNEESDKMLLGNQTYLYDEIDELIKLLKEKRPLVEINNQLAILRIKTVRIVLAAIEGGIESQD
jgi:hypothetical protein